MPKGNNPLLRYLGEWTLWGAALIVGLLGGGGAAVFKALGWDNPVPVWVAWIFCLVVVALAGYRLYAKLHYKHQALLDRARSQAGLSPDMRDRLRAIKRIAGEVNGAIQGLGPPLDRETLNDKLEHLWRLASRMGEHENIRAATTFYCSCIRTLLTTLESSESSEERRAVEQELKREERRFFLDLVSTCNGLLERYPELGQEV